MSSRTTRQSRRKFLTAVPCRRRRRGRCQDIRTGTAGRRSGEGRHDRGGRIDHGARFSPEDETALANSLNNRLRTFQQLRQSAVPFDTEVAVVFKPALPGREPRGPATPGAPIKYAKPPQP
jgi:hypothetical protein